MKRWHLEILICPQCLPKESPLGIKAESQSGDEIKKGYLWCRRCRAEFPIINAIPMLLARESPSNLYLDKDLVSNYAWLHYSDLIEKSIDNPFLHYANQLSPSKGFLDLGCGTGRLTFEMARKTELSIGLDLSFQMIQIAQKLYQGKSLRLRLPMEGEIREVIQINPDPQWQRGDILFLVGDALRPPFLKGIFDSIASINLIDRVPNPIKVLKEINRLLKPQNSQLLVSDPFSWNITFTPKAKWLGGKSKGRFSGSTIKNLEEIFTGKMGIFLPPFAISQRGSIQWELRHHKNRKEVIVSEFLVGNR